MAALKPKSIRLRTYQVGFGDCFLLTFRYPPKNGKSQDRHLLIDFGSTGLPATADEKLMLNVAQNIEKACEGKLHAVVATHRHKDHISGFATSSAKDSGGIIASLKPDIVIQPWTEDPKAKTDATKPTKVLSDTKAFTAGLDRMHAFSGAALKEIDRRGKAYGEQNVRQLAFLGEDNLANLSAVKNLMDMSNRHAYVHFGSKSGLEKILPGVTTTVLGPPTLEQTDTIRKQRSRDEAEFWHFQAAAGDSFTAAGKSPFARKFHYAQRPPYARWIIPRMDAMRGDQLLELVRALDKQMNNTSVILLFEAGDQKLLFPGDAQIENWSYALEQAEKNKSLGKRLKAVNLYKVGHHGSLNATPKSLWHLFEHKGSSHDHDRLKTVVSTMEGKHGKKTSGTEVPRTKLVTELKKNSDFFTTQELTKKELFHDVEIKL